MHRADIVSEYQIAILRTLARAYVLAGQDDRAEATLSELMPVINAPATQVRPFIPLKLPEIHGSS